tara:strand:- start:100 stop:864 length:765 start_codon:yes stop_codon:yes gene_type:complete
LNNLLLKLARKKLFNISIRSLISNFYYTYKKVKYREYRSKNNLNFDWNKQNFNRTALLNFIISCHSKKYNSRYLEIGCQNNLNFNAIGLKSKVGVDPDIGGTLRLTSDQFFKQNKSKFDLIFLDGLHTYEQTKIDLLNSLAAINNDGVIVLDDFIPRNWKEHFTPRVQTNWNGDIWKIAFELVKSEGIDYRIIPIDGGQCVIFKNSNEYYIPDLGSEYKDLDYDYFFNNFNKLSVIDLDSGLRWISESLENKKL